MQNSKRGRTPSDLIAEHPKVAGLIFITITLVLLAIVILILSTKTHVKIGYFEMNKPENIVISDTVSKIKPIIETIKPNSTLNNHTRQATLNSAESSINNTNNIATNKEDTMQEKEVQTYNINTGTNNGIIGSNNNINVGLQKPQPSLTLENKQKLVELIEADLLTNKDSTNCISIEAIMGNKESHSLAKEILEFLTINKYNVYNDIGVYMSSNITYGVIIGRRKPEKCISVRVGYL